MVIYDILKDATSNEKEQTVSMCNNIDLLKIDGGFKNFSNEIICIFLCALFSFLTNDTKYCFRSDQISRSVVSDSLRPHESQHARPPCPSPTPGVHPDSRPSSQ